MKTPIEMAVSLRPVVLRAVQHSIDSKLLRVREQAELFIDCGPDEYDALYRAFSSLHELYGAALIILEPVDRQGIDVRVRRSTNTMCDRCRRYRDMASPHKFFTGVNLCGRCVTTMCETGAIDQRLPVNPKADKVARA